MLQNNETANVHLQEKAFGTFSNSETAESRFGISIYHLSHAIKHFIADVGSVQSPLLQQATKLKKPNKSCM